MRVEFSPEVLSISQYWELLNRITYFFGEERHLWYTDDPDTLVSSDWFVSADETREKRRRQELFERSVNLETYLRSQYPEGGPHSIRITVSTATRTIAGTRLSPDDAYCTLNRPGYIAVEDAESDRAFLDAMVHAFNRIPIYEALENNWIELAHMGGCGQLLRTLDRIRKRDPGPMRTVVLVDSDRLLPGEETENVRKVNRHCPRFDACGHVLCKREAENYLPLGVLFLRKGRPAQCFARAFRRLSQKQRDFFDMKNGFPAAGIPEKQTDLYATVNSRDKDILQRGCGDSCWERFLLTDALHGNLFSKEEIKKICIDDPDEIPRILDSIEELI